MNDILRHYPRRLVILGLLVITLLVSVTLYVAHGNDFAPLSAPASFRPPLTNPEIMQNWLPENSYQYTIARVDDYLRTNNLMASSMVATDRVAAGSGAYNFAVTIQPQQQTFNISVAITNYGSVLSTAVTIEGQLQTPQVPGSNQDTTGQSDTPSYKGFDALLNVGVTAIQTSELRDAILQFTPSAANVVIDPSTINSDTLNTDATAIDYTFSVAIDGKTYHAKFSSIGFLKSHLVLFDAKGSKQLFDSGVMSQGN